MRCFFYLYILLIFCATHVAATSLESPRFRIESPTINFSLPPGDKKSAPLTEEEARFERLGYIDKTNATAERIELHLSESILNYDELDANTFIDRETQLSLVDGPAVYSIRMDQESDLKKVSGATIPATRCDGAGRNCTISLANQWRSSASYGLGYTVNSTDAPDDFFKGTRFRPLPTAKKNQSGPLMQGHVKKDLVKGQVTYRLNTSPAQEDGTYEHTVTFLALPGY